MTGKKVTLGTRPSKKQEPLTADAWVESSVNEKEETTEPIKRLTIDIPVSLHRSIKAQCAMRGTNMVKEVRELLLQKYGKG